MTFHLYNQHVTLFSLAYYLITQRLYTHRYIHTHTNGNMEQYGSKHKLLSFLYIVFWQMTDTQKNNIPQTDWNTDDECLFFISIENTCNNKIYVCVCPDIQKYRKCDAKTSLPLLTFYLLKGSKRVNEVKAWTTIEGINATRQINENGRLT